MTVLVVLPNWLGDVVMATPLLQKLAHARDARGRAIRVVAAVRDSWAPLLKNDPRLADTLIYERGGRHAGWRGAWSLAASWRRISAAGTVLCPPSFRVAMVATLAGVGRRVGYRTDGRRLLLNRSLPPELPRGVMHHADELCALGDVLLTDLGLVADGGDPGLPELPGLDGVPPADTGQGPPVWVLAPGATYGSAKAWPAGRVAEFLRLAVTERGVRVAVVGDGAGTAITDAIRREAADLNWRHAWSGEAGVVDMVGKTSLLELVGVLRSARAFLGNDSGVMHLSAALGVPTLGLFGSSSVAWTAPRGPRARALAAVGFPCQPCFQPVCSHERFCLDTISGFDAMSTLDELLNDGRKDACP